MLPVSLPELVDQLCIEQRGRWLKGERVSAEKLLAEYPRIAEDFEATFDLIYNEYLIREELGEEVSAEDFCQRFPRFGERLQRQLRFRSALSSDFDSVFPSSSLPGQSTDTEGPSDGQTAATAPSSLPAPPPQYSIHRCLGSGASGTVYEATDHRRQDRIALKTLHRHLAPWTGHLKNEFRTLAALNHVNLVQLYELFEHAGHYWIAMELVDGTDAVSALRADIPDSAGFTGRVRQFMRQLTAALHFLHQHGVLHCDIKPANLLWTPAGRAALLDFAL
ncbi:MAG: serine/threonine protein kinase, partial [Planctomycetaceae bacterium]|nr:serine/threonine protein kinase [Planctomycetaceae bacterium]